MAHSLDGHSRTLCLGDKQKLNILLTSDISPRMLPPSLTPPFMSAQTSHPSTFALAWNEFDFLSGSGGLLWLSALSLKPCASHSHCHSNVLQWSRSCVNENRIRPTDLWGADLSAPGVKSHRGFFSTLAEVCFFSFYLPNEHFEKVLSRNFRLDISGLLQLQTLDINRKCVQFWFFIFWFWKCFRVWFLKFH